MILSLISPLLSKLFFSISGYYTNNILNRLKIRTKLILFLIIPILTILFFSISGIYTKVQEIRVTKSSRNFTIVSFHLADLVHELQKERGLSAGFVGGGGKHFREEVLKQRKQTDEKLVLFNQDLDIYASEEDYWGLNDKFTYLQQGLSRLTVVRKAINTLNKGNFFSFYSNLNAHALDIIKYLQVFTNDAPLARQGDAYSSLLYLQERAGQERGALNGIFASGKLDVKLFQEISAYVANQKTILNNYYTVVSNEYQDMLRMKMRHPVVVEVESLRSAAIYKARRNELLNDLQMMIGYGGLIHDFKNYIIRGKDWYAEHFSKISVDAKDIIEQYQRLPGMSPEGIANLNSIETTFDKYQAILKDVTTMKKSGRSIIEIDNLVSIDDKLAINAIKQLRKDVTSQDTSEWWEKATFRIELVKDVSDAIKLDIADRTQQIIAATEKSVSLFLLLSMTNLAISFFLGYLLMRRPVEELVNISTNMRNMQKQRDFDQLLVVSGHDEISDLANAFNDMINERKRAVEQIHVLYHAVEQSPVTIVITDINGNIEYVNPKFAQLTGYTSEEAIGNNTRILKSGKTPPEEYKELWKTITSGKEWMGQFCNSKKNGELYWESASISPVKNAEGVISRFIAVKEDITERKKSEEQIKASLKEKEILLAEIHHRVKNNMQIISSLLRLQAENIKDKRLLDIFQESQNRIRSMALIHEDLYQNNDLSKIDFHEYAQTLTARLVVSFGVDPDRIITSVNIDNIFLGIDVAVPCGLILNELLTNSLKYAFPPLYNQVSGEGRDGKICIDFHSENDKYFLTYSDNGVGLPENLDFQNTKTMGLNLINGLVKQINGTIELNRSEGTEFKIIFKS